MKTLILTVTLLAISSPVFAKGAVATPPHIIGPVATPPHIIVQPKPPVAQPLKR